MHEARLFVGGKWVDGESQTTVADKFSGEPVGLVHNASREQVALATRGVAQTQAGRPTVPHDRFLVLARASELLRERTPEFVQIMVSDAGFTVQDAQREVERTVQTLLISGEEAKRIHGEVVPMHGAPGWNGRLGFTTRHPLGVVAAVTPFNSPLNTVAHKVGPALAAGNGVVLKPASLTPVTAEHLVRLLLDAGLDPGLIALVHGAGSTVGQWLLEDPIPAFYAFTGSTEVGEHLHRTVGLRKTQLELGSISSTLVCADAAVEKTAALCVNAAFRKAGQVCTSVQRLYVHELVLADFVDALRDELSTRKVGDPADPQTFVGPVISVGNADRIADWIERARAGGAKIVAGGNRDRQVIEPTVLVDVTPDMEVMCQEVFGPIVSVRPFQDLDATINEVNGTPYGLSAGIFTADVNRALTAAERIRVGSVHINETSSSRIDLMPYGGVKLSGMGKEGPRYAIEEMTEERLITLGRQ